MHRFQSVVLLLFSLAALAAAAPVNLALQKRAAQSSTYQNDPNYAAAKGVDGAKGDASLLHTEEQDNP